jgi:hypothetical protein
VKNDSRNQRSTKIQYLDPVLSESTSAHADAPGSDDIDFSDLVAFGRDDVVALYNDMLGDVFPRSTGRSKLLDRCIGARLREHGDRTWWVALFTRAGASELADGFYNKTTGKTWKPTGIDWFVNEENIRKILDGAYDPKQTQQPRPQVRQASPIPATVVDAETKQQITDRVATRGAVLAAIDALPESVQFALTSRAVAEVNAEWRGTIDPEAPLYRNTVRGRMVAILMTYGENLDTAIAAFTQQQTGAATA